MIQVKNSAVPMTVLAATVVWLLGASFVSAGAQATKRVTAQGQAAGVDMGAEDEAIQDAKRNAVRKGCGELITSSTMVENFELFEDRILSKAAGFIVESGTKTRCEKDATNNVTTCIIDALVATADLNEAFKAVKWKAPRIAVAVTESINDTDGTPPKFSLSLQPLAEKLFTDAGYRVTDQAVVQKNLEKMMAAANLEGSFEQLADLSKKLDSDIVATFHFECPPCRKVEMAPPAPTMFACDASLAYRVVQLDKAEVIASDLLTPDGSLKAGSARVDMKEARKFFSSQGGKAVKDAKKNLDAAVVDARSVDCTFVCGDGIQDCVDEFRKVRAEVRRIRGVEDFTIRQGMGSTILTEIAYRYPTDRLAQAIVELESDEYAYKTMDVSQDTLRIEVRKK